MRTIKFEGFEYPFKTISLPFGERIISTEKLNDKLMNDDGSYRSEEARIIDEKIFYFVEERTLRFRENEIIKMILSEI